MVFGFFLTIWAKSWITYSSPSNVTGNESNAPETLYSLLTITFNQTNYHFSRKFEKSNYLNCKFIITKIFNINKLQYLILNV